jgi:hypothetical protein
MESTDSMTDVSIPYDISEASSSDTLFGPPSLQHTDSFSNTSYDSSVSSDSYTIHSSSSTSTDSYNHLGPPPLGSLIDIWDTRFSTSTFHDFPELFKDGVVTVDDTAPLMDDDSSISSAASLDINQHQAPTLRLLSGTSPGQLINSGGIFCMCNDLACL